MDKSLEKNLIDNGFAVKRFKNTKELNRELLKQIKLGDSVGFGGSITVQDIGIYEELKDRGNKVFWHWKKDVEDPINKAKDADVYITSTNALTIDGKLVNMDGNGNRVASMIFGHRDVFVIVGKNKITDDYYGARDRIRNIAAPLNAKRLNCKTPCVHTGKCSDCDSPDRICKVEVVIHKNPGNTNINIYIVDEDLGY